MNSKHSSGHLIFSSFIPDRILPVGCGPAVSGEWAGTQRSAGCGQGPSGQRVARAACRPPRKPTHQSPARRNQSSSIRRLRRPAWRGSRVAGGSVRRPASSRGAGQLRGSASVPRCGPEPTSNSRLLRTAGRRELDPERRHRHANAGCQR